MVIVVDFITTIYYPVISLLCVVWVRAPYRARETREVLLVGMPGVFLGFYHIWYVIGGEISKMV